VELSVGAHGSPPVAVVTVGGEVDVYSAPQLRDQLTETLAEQPTVVVDLSGVEFIDSTGLGALVAARTTAAERGGTLALVCTQQRILKLFAITGLDSVFAIFNSVADAAAGSA
jgi:anti-sigma B factor antagonist